MRIMKTLLIALAVSLGITSQLAAQAGPADWTTPAERCEYRCTPRYDDTMAYIRRVAAAAPRQVKTESWGKTGEGRELVGVIVSKDGVFDPAAIHKANRPVVYIQNGIHAGEIEGKDASLALLRDMVITKTRAALLDKAVVLIVPVYNIDGHERVSRYNRINQNGPEEMGWRTQANNLNLNRDYMKADAVETRQFLHYFTKWLPDYFIDDHVTDGADYQYDVTYTVDFGADVDPAIAAWQRDELRSYVEKSVTASGHLIGPAYIGVAEADPIKGLKAPADSPRFSTGYMVLQNRPGMLVEMHMLKDYKTRVLGNYELLRAVLEKINADADQLVQMNRAADAATIAAGKSYDPARKIALRTAPSDRPETLHYLGYKRKHVLSEVSGAVWTQYTHEPEAIDLPLYDDFQSIYSVVPPRAYIVPAQWTQVIDLLRDHGVQMQPTTARWESEVETYRCVPKWNNMVFEGRHPMSIVDFGDTSRYTPVCQPVKEKLAFAPGSMLVPLDQRTAKVIVGLLEPDAPDSCIQWGFFDAIFEQKEFGEAYVLEPLAREMLAKDPALKTEFEKKLADDKAFAGDPDARLSFFYDHSPYRDARIGLYPVGRLATLDGVPLK